ncbi:hypothetical protein [Amycolatopsis rifamycinica]|uniref:Uncharacterized protein n=1 Tax=Amycolatopsis rifamycinica TaxID=287986 RepID=A0A066UEQ7_9PSEU|nr:hypothetical protein [Amycolatopsis rifamycinica]KDN22629.1 hypothetical protein DV20_08840 [Amycolatopsis rifamycinica]
MARLVTAQRQSLTPVEAPPPPPPPPVELPVEPVAEPPAGGSWNYVRPPPAEADPAPRPPRGRLTDPVGPRSTPVGFYPPAVVREHQFAAQQQRVAASERGREYLARQPWYRPVLDRGGSAADGFMGPVQYDELAGTGLPLRVSWRPFHVIDALQFEARALTGLPIPAEARTGS